MATATMAQAWRLEQIDELTAKLILELQLEDIEELVSSSKGKCREGDISDTELALQSYKQELECSASVLSDRRMTRSIARAVMNDGDVLSESVSEEQSAAQDRDVACELGGSVELSDVKPWTVTSEEMDDELLDKLAVLWVSPANEYENQKLRIPNLDPFDYTEDAGDCGEASAWASAKNIPNIREKHQCIACQEDKPFWEVVRVPCRHEYCRECIQGLFTSSIKDDGLFPIRCCRQPIALTFVRIFLTADIVKDYEEKKVEFNTSNKTYCSSPSCSAFIHPENIHDDCATCDDCGTLTCSMCKSAAHGGDCPAEEGLQELLDMATENGWQRCYNCRRLVELETGCNHMTCKCTAQFCYICGLRWKTCICAQWDEDRLIARANRIVARQPRQAGLAGEHRLAEAVQHLRTRHECDHDTWSYVRGSHQCEECYHTLPSYIFECQQCRIQACNRCRRNRL